MHWKTKASIQNAFALLPYDLANKCYFALQRNFGGMQSPLTDFSTSRFRHAQSIWQHVSRLKPNTMGSTVFDLGTGWSAHLPVSYFLMGADRVVTYDLHRHMRPSVNKDVIHFLVNRSEDLRDTLGDLLVESRYEELLSRISQKSFQAKNLLALCGTTYVAPSDASSIHLETDTVDFYTSNVVLQHIPGEVLRNIFEEANRVTKSDGVFVHRVHYGDHFAHNDDSITAGNFLQFDDDEWLKLAGNHFMYQNRLRPSEIIQMLEQSGHAVDERDKIIDETAVSQLRSGELVLDPKFSGFAENDLAAYSSTLVSQIKQSQT